MSLNVEIKIKLLPMLPAFLLILYIRLNKT